MTAGTIVDLRSYLVPAGGRTIVVREPAGSARDIAIPSPPAAMPPESSSPPRSRTSMNAAVLTLNTTPSPIGPPTGSRSHAPPAPTASSSAGRRHDHGPLRTELGFDHADDTGALTYTSDSDRAGRHRPRAVQLGRRQPDRSPAHRAVLHGPTRAGTSTARCMSLAARRTRVQRDQRTARHRRAVRPVQPRRGPGQRAVHHSPDPVPRHDLRGRAHPDDPHGVRRTRTWPGTRRADANTCGGFESLVPLQPCTNNAQFSLISRPPAARGPHRCADRCDRRLHRNGGGRRRDPAPAPRSRPGTASAPPASPRSRSRWRTSRRSGAAAAPVPARPRPGGPAQPPVEHHRHPDPEAPHIRHHRDGR